MFSTKSVNCHATIELNSILNTQIDEKRLQNNIFWDIFISKDVSQVTFGQYYLFFWLFSSSFAGCTGYVQDSMF